MGTYRNPDPVVANTGSAVYAGIQKLAGDVYTFANDERKRKAEIIGKSLAEQQAIDDDVNKLGLNIGDGGSGLEKEIYEEAQATKRRIAEQYNLMAKTFATPETIATAKAEIAKLNKYPEQLIGDLSTGQYMVSQYNEAIMKAPGSAGSISFTNDANMLAVVSDMRSGGKNTKMVTGENGGRFLVTNVDGKESKLNITAITNGIKNNPDYQLFKDVVDDSSTATNFMNATFGEKPDALQLIKEGLLIPDKDFKVADAEYASFQLDEEKARAKAKGLANSLVNDPAQYTHLNSIWMDHMGNSLNVNEAIKDLGKEKVSELIEDHYFEGAKNTLKKTVKLYAKRDKPKVEKESDMKKSLRQLATGFKKGGKRGSGLAKIDIGGNSYQIVGTKLADQRVTPMINEIDDKGNFTNELIPDTSGDFPLYLQDSEGNLIYENGEPVLNVEGGQVATGLRK